MTNTRIVFFSIIISILLAVLILWCADVLAHGNPTEHFAPYTAEDPCWGKACLDAQFAGGHGHIDIDHEDKREWGYWTCEGYQHVDRNAPGCAPPPVPRSEPDTRSEPIAVVLERVIEDEPEPPVDIEIPESPETPVAVELESWEVQFYQGWNLVSFPVLPEGVETISDLYHRWTFFAAHNADIVTLIDQNWVLYNGIGDGVAGEIPLSANLGLVVRLDWASWLGLRGVPLPNEGSVDLRPGVNLVGFADLPFGVKRPSDLLSDVICAAIVTRRGELYLIGRAGDSGDEPLERGQAVILVATEPTTLQLASPTMDQDVSVRGWGAEKLEGVGN